ncbi:hypothetical protein TYRP_016378 [Tyrophagus putrescentiae]|nr:hypothetical protein TYRP_016378 [Tyrophagus putrescentiae]
MKWFIKRAQRIDSVDNADMIRVYGSIMYLLGKCVNIPNHQINGRHCESHHAIPVCLEGVQRHLLRLRPLEEGSVDGPCVLESSHLTDQLDGIGNDLLPLTVQTEQYPGGGDLHIALLPHSVQLIQQVQLPRGKRPLTSTGGLLIQLNEKELLLARTEGLPVVLPKEHLPLNQQVFRGADPLFGEKDAGVQQTSVVLWHNQRHALAC